MNPPRKTTGLFLTPRGPYGQRLPERAQNHLHASDTAVSRAFDRAGRWIRKKFVPAVKEHVVFGADGEKSFHSGEPFSGQVGIVVSTNKRVMEDQKRFDDEHPSHSIRE
jgi:hypothetical protein